MVARRRLRASESQIVLATRAAKQKRIEFESLLIAYSSTKLQALRGDTPGSTARMAPTGSASRARPASVGGGSSRQRISVTRPRSSNR